MILGRCPYCDDGKIEVRKKEIIGKKVELKLKTQKRFGIKK